jgi:TPR repeat protein
MARLEMCDADAAAVGGKPANADTFYQLGMMYSIGGSVPADFISAHKWFNIAAMKGKRDAIRLRQEIAANMSAADISAAQHAARAWIIAHDQNSGAAEAA